MNAECDGVKGVKTPRGKTIPTFSNKSKGKNCSIMFKRRGPNMGKAMVAENRGKKLNVSLKGGRV